MRASSRDFVSTGFLPLLPLIALAAGWGPPVGEPADVTDVVDVADASKVRVDEILTELQKRSDGLSDIRCKVRFAQEDRINLTTWTKVGEILFLITKPNPHFLIHFEKTETDGVAYKQEWYLFDGTYLHEGIERLKQVTKREIVAEGETLDMFDLETAPFPLPFGQKKDKILRNFDVTLAAPALGDPPNTDHLVCVPKPDSKLAERYDKLEFFILKDIHLPSRVVVTKNDGLEINTADFPGLSEKSINTGVKKKDFAHPKVWKKDRYEVVVEKLHPDR